MIEIRQNKINRLYWGPISSVDYLWGSEIQGLAKDKVRFKNPLMPSGQLIKKWQSITNYGKDRMAPSLPLLKRGESYSLNVCMSSEPSHNVMVEIVFQDRFGVTVKRQVTTDRTLSFVYPEHAYSYQVRLLSAGMQEFTFHYFTITPNSSKKDDVLN